MPAGLMKICNITGWVQRPTSHRGIAPCCSRLSGFVEVTVTVHTLVHEQECAWAVAGTLDRLRYSYANTSRTVRREAFQAGRKLAMAARKATMKNQVITPLAEKV